ncbi:unnamed protein product, partial [marine sediment metagenome]
IEMLKSDDDAIWKPAAEELKKIGPPAAEKLAQLFRTPTADAHAVTVLESMAANKEVQEIMVRGLSSSNSNTRHCSLIILGKSGNHNHVPRIIPLLKDEGAGVPIVATLALAQLGGDQAFSALLDALKHPRDETMRWLIAQHLSEMGRPEAIPHLKEALKQVSFSHPSAARRIVRNIRNLERKNGLAPKGVFDGMYSMVLRTLDPSPGPRGWRYLHAYNFRKADTIYVQIPASEERRDRYYQALLAKPET